MIVGEYLDQPPRLQIVDEIQPRFIDQAFAGQRPAAHHIGIIAHPVAGDGDGAVAVWQRKAPALVYLLAPHEAQAIMPSQFVHLQRRAGPCNVRRCSTQCPAIVVGTNRLCPKSEGADKRSAPVSPDRPFASACWPAVCALSITRAWGK